MTLPEAAGHAVPAGTADGGSMNSVHVLGKHDQHHAIAVLALDHAHRLLLLLPGRVRVLKVSIRQSPARTLRQDLSYLFVRSDSTMPILLWQDKLSVVLLVLC